MLRIEWDKKDLKEVINNYPGNYTILDYWIPLWMYVEDVEISGLKDIPGGDVTHLVTFFPELISVIQIADWDNLGTKGFITDRKRIQETRVRGGGFEFTVSEDLTHDIIIINYTNKGITEWRQTKIPLKEYAEGVLKAVIKMISDLEQIAPNKCVDDDGLISLKKDYNTIRGWYEGRYHEPIEEKYVIPQRFF